MTRAVVVDTNVLSMGFKQDSRYRAYHPFLTGQLLVISFMTLAELDLWALRHRWGQARRERMDRHLQKFVVQPYDRRLCSLWAEVSNQGLRKGRPISTADAWIAATALLRRIPLVTHNPGDYSGVGGLTVLTAAKPGS